MFRLSATKCHRVTSRSEAIVRAIWFTKSSSVRVGPIDGITTVPCATSKLAINVTVPRRIYSNSRRSSCPGSMSRVGCVRSSAWMPVISSVDSPRSPAVAKAGACLYRVVRAAIFTAASASGSALSQERLLCGLGSACFYIRSDMAFGDGLDNAAFAGLIREFARRPMADGPPRRRRGLTGQRDDLAPLLGAEGGRRPWAWGVLETLGHGPAGTFEPVATPAPDCGARCPKTTGNVGCREPLCQQEDHLRPEAEVLGRLVGTDQRVERLALFLREWHGRGLKSRHRRLLYFLGSVV